MYYDEEFSFRSNSLHNYWNYYETTTDTEVAEVTEVTEDTEVTEVTENTEVIEVIDVQDEEVPADFDPDELAEIGELEAKIAELNSSISSEIFQEDTINQNTDFKTSFARLVSDQLYFLKSMEETIHEKTMKTVSIDLRIFIIHTIDTFVSMLKMQNMCNEEEITSLVPLLRQACKCVVVSLCNARKEYSQLSLEQQHIISEKTVNLGNEVMQIYQGLCGDSLMTEDKLKECVRRLTSVCCDIANIHF